MCDRYGPAILQLFFENRDNTSITAKEYPDGDTFEITATVANASPKYVNLAVSNDQLVTIVFEGVNPPSSPLGPAAPKNIRIGG